MKIRNRKFRLDTSRKKFIGKICYIAKQPPKRLAGITEIL